MSRAPAYQTYSAELLASTTGLTLSAVGAMSRILWLMWSQSDDQCSILDDDPLISRMMGVSLDEWKNIRAELQHPARPVFEGKNGRLMSPYLRQEALKQRKYRRMQREKSLKAVEARLSRGTTHGSPAGAARGTSSSSSPSPSPYDNIRSSRRNVLNGHQASFFQFWAIYPKKRGKGKAEKVWAKLQPDDALVAAIFEAIGRAKQTPDWLKERGQFIPHPATWLNAKGWEDEYTVPISTGRIPL